MTNVLLCVALLAGCGYSQSAADDAPDAGVTYLCDVGFSNNHGHTLEISSDDVANPQDRTYVTMGQASHTHQLTLTKAQFVRLQSVTSEVHTTTTVDAGHSHDAAVDCLHVK